MIKITANFPHWAYRLSRDVLFLSGVWIGINIPEPHGHLTGTVQLFCAVFGAVVSMWFINGAVAAMKK